MDPSRLSDRYVRYVRYTATEVLHEACMSSNCSGAYRATDTAACRAQTGSYPCTSGWSQTRTARSSAHLMSDAP